MHRPTRLRVALLTYSTRPRGGVVHTLALAEALVARGAEVDVWSLARGGDTGFFRPVEPAVGLRLVPFPDAPDAPDAHNAPDAPDASGADGADGAETVGARVLRSIDLLGAAFRAAGGHDAYDVVHAQDCISANAVGRCVRTVHHLDTFTTPELARCHERAVVEPAVRVCVSAAVAAELRAGWGLDATVIPNGVDAAPFARAASGSPAAVAARERWRSRFGRYVVAVGGIEPRKGTADLVEAVALLRRTHPDVRLVVAGGDTLFDYRGYRAQVDALAIALGVQPDVLGPVPHDELPALVAGAAVFAFPSTVEGFGLAAMEALAAGVPLVCRDLPVLREVFGGAARFAHGPAGVAAALAEAIEGRPAAGGVPATTLATTGRALADRHTWDAAALAHLRLYRGLAVATR